MSCCGNQRKKFNTTNPARRSREQPKAGSVRSAPKRSASIYFQYTGKRGLIFVGPISRKQYRFERSGAIVAVDARDRRAMATVPILRQVRNPKN
jgi:hypothetical protein